MSGTSGRRGTRGRMVESSAQLLRERGAAAVTVDAVLAHSGAPRGSVYHHFPGGRDEILLAGLERSGGYISQRLERATAEGDPVRVVAWFVAFWKSALLDTDFQAGCPVVAATADGRRPLPEVSAAAAAILDTWHRQLVDLVRADGHPAGRSETLATLIVAAIEGAIVLCRSVRSVTPLDDVAAELTHLLETR